MSESPSNLQRVFEQAFSVQDIARPLLSVDDEAPVESVRKMLESRQVEIAGVRSQGLVTAYVETSDLTSGRCGDVARPVAPALIVADTTPFAPLILRLQVAPRLFVHSLGQIAGVVTRSDLLQPPARMWLFGMVTLIEMRFNRLIERHCPDDSWRASLSAGRLAKAQALLDERCRRNQRLNLADCLQFSDKAQIIARTESLRNSTRFQSRTQVEQIGKRLEKLRNNLAHSQDVVAEDWETIVLLSENLESVLSGPTTDHER